MAVILRNEHGAIAVNKGVIERMIIGDLLDMGDRVFLCNKKGKLIKKNPTPFIDPDYFDAIEVYEKRQEVRVKIFIMTAEGSSISDVSDEIFSHVESDFDLLKLPKPGSIVVSVKGVMSDQIAKRNIEVVRNNG